MGRMSWADELKRFEAFDTTEKLRWLAALQFSLTLLGRETYVAGTYAVNNPILLRKINEFFHKIASYQLQLLDPSTDTMSDADAVLMIETCRQEIEVGGEHLMRSMHVSKVLN